MGNLVSDNLYEARNNLVLVQTKKYKAPEIVEPDVEPY